MISIITYIFEAIPNRLPISRYYNVEGKPINKLEVITKQQSTGETKAQLKNTGKDVTIGYRFGPLTKPEYIKKFGDNF